MSSTKAATKRADEVRKRRASQPRKSSRAGASKRSQKASAPSMPAVLVRGSLAASMVQERRGKKRPKRRYDVALSTPGAEMRLPALPRLHIGWRLVSGMLVIGMAYLLYTVWTTPTLRVLAAEVKGVERLTSQDINAVASVAEKPVFMVEPDKVQRELSAAFPELSEVTVEVSLPAKVTVKVIERQPIIAWIQDDQETWVDASGIAFPARGESESLIRVKARTSPPGMEGSNNEETNAEEGNADEGNAEESETEIVKEPVAFLSPDLVEAILLLAEEAPEGRPLVYTSDHGLGWEDKRGWEVYFGANNQDMDMKLRVYQEIVRRLKKEDVRPNFVSVEYVHAPYYRLDR